MINIPDNLDNQLPDCEFMYNIISTKYPDKLRHLIQEARDKRAIGKQIDYAFIVEVKLEIKEAIMSVLSQKSKLSNY